MSVEWAVLRRNAVSPDPAVWPCASREEAEAMRELFAVRDREPQNVPDNVTIGMTPYGPPYVASREVGPWERVD